jgi:hypothetical protein
MRAVAKTGNFVLKIGRWPRPVYSIQTKDISILLLSEPEALAK